MFFISTTSGAIFCVNSTWSFSPVLDDFPEETFPEEGKYRTDEAWASQACPSTDEAWVHVLHFAGVGSCMVAPVNP